MSGSGAGKKTDAVFGGEDGAGDADDGNGGRSGFGGSTSSLQLPAAAEGSGSGPRRLAKRRQVSRDGVGGDDGSAAAADDMGLVDGLADEEEGGSAAATRRQRAESWRRTLLLALAVTIHNIPEGTGS